MSLELDMLGTPFPRRLLAGLALALISLPALAAGDPNAARSIVARHCVMCHDVPGYVAPHGRTAVNAPSFQVIADDPERYPAERLDKFLRQPHFPMTQFTLSPSDIRNLVAFIESLRKH